MTTFTWKSPVNGDWNDPNAWDLGVPGASDPAVLVAGTYIVTMSQSNAITGLTVGAGVILAIADNVGFSWDAGVIANGGTIAENSNGSNTDILINGPTVTLQGGGGIAMGDRAQNRIYGHAAGLMLINVDNVIAGSGQIGASTDLILDNQAAGTIMSTGAAGMSILLGAGGALSNEGLIEDTGPGGLGISGIVIDQSGGGTIAAAGTNTSVTLGGDTVKGGNVLASGPGATVSLTSGTTLTTPSISALNGGLVQLPASNTATLDGSGGAITLTGPFLISDNAGLVVLGTIVNTSTITEASNGSNTDIQINSAVVTLKGGGTVAMGDRPQNRIFALKSGDKLINVDNTITGSGQLGVGTGLALDNQAAGRIVSTGGAGMAINPGAAISNEGLIEDTGPGGLSINSTSVDQTGGGTILAAGSGAVVALNSVTLTGGSLLATGTGTVNLTGGSVIKTQTISALTGGLVQLPSSNAATLDALGGAITLTGPFLINDVSALGLRGTIINAGTITQASNGSNTDIQLDSATVTLKGGGTISMGDRAQNRILATSSSLLINVDNAILGSGQIGLGGSLSLDNQAKGIIRSTGNAGITMSFSGGLRNEGVIEDTGAGGLALSGLTVDQTGGGTIAATGSGASVSLTGDTVTGGTVIASGAGAMVNIAGSSTLTASAISAVNGGLVQIPGGNVALLDAAAGTVTITGPLLINDNSTLNLRGAFANTATITQASNGSLTDIAIDSATVTLTGGGTIASDDRAQNRLFATVNGDKLINVDNVITGSGQLGVGSGLIVDNQAKGIIRSTGGAGLSIDIGHGQTLNNEGLIEDTGSGGLGIRDTTIDQSGGGTIAATGTNASVTLTDDLLIGGALIASGAGAAINLTNSSTVQTQAISTLNGGLIQIISGNAAWLDATGGAITLTGNLLVNDNSTLNLRGTIDHSGSINLSSNGSFTQIIVDSDTVTLTGGGTIAVSDRAVNRIYATTNGNKLINVDNIITGSGNIGAGTGLVLDNQAQGTILSTGGAGLTISVGGGQSLTNEGLIEDTGTGGIGISSASIVQSSTGTIAAIGANTSISLSADTLSGGTLLASGTGSAIILGGGSTLTSVAVNTLGGAVLQVPGGNTATLDAAGGTFALSGLVQVSDNATLGLRGTIANAGTIALNSNGSFTQIIVDSPTVTLTGGGTIALDDRTQNRIYGAANGDKLVNVDNLITGSGQIGVGTGLGLDNQAKGTIASTGAAGFAISLGGSLPLANEGQILSTGGGGLTISLSGGQLLTNDGLIEDTGTGGIGISGASIVQSVTGTIEAIGDNTSISLFNDTLLGGTLIASGTGSAIILGGGSTLTSVAVHTLGATVIQVPASNAATLDSGGGTFGLSGLVQVGDGATLGLRGTIANPGTVALNSNGSFTQIIVDSPTVTLTGGGTIIADDRVQNRIYTSASGDKLVNVDNLITGSGQIGSGTGLVLDNQAKGTILSTGGAGLVISLGGGQALTNEGLIEDTGTGGISLNNATIDQSGGGTIAAVGSNTSVSLLSDTLTGGTVLASGTGSAITIGGGSTLSSVVISTLNGAILQVAGGNSAVLDATASAISLGGLLLVNDAASLTLRGTFNSSGTIVDASNGSFTDVIIGSTLVTLQGGGTISLGDRTQNRIYATTNGDKLVNIDNLITGAGQIGAGTGLLIDNQKAGTILAAGNNALLIQPGGGATLTNEGLLAAAGGSLVFGLFSVTNTGTVAAQDGGTVTYQNGTGNTNSDGAGTLTGGAWKAIDGGKGASVSITGGAVVTDAADITLSGAGAQLSAGDGTTQTLLENSLTAIATTGSLHVLGGRNYSTAKDLGVTGLFDLGGGTLVANSLTVATTGRVSGFGTVALGVANGGTIDAVDGLLNIAGAVTGNGQLHIAANATLELGQATSETVVFDGAKAVLKLDQPALYTGTLASLVVSDTIDLAGLNVTEAELKSQSLVIKIQGGGTLSYAVADDLSVDRFAPFGDGLGGTNVVVYRKAQPSAHTPEPVLIGNVHVGDTAKQTLTLSNLAPADGYSENLDAAFGTIGAGLIASGSFSGLVAGATDSTSLAAGLDTTTDGIKNGGIALLPSTDGIGVDGLGPLSLITQTVSVDGTVYALAAPGVIPTTLEFGVTRTGQPALTASTKISNGTTADAFQESLAFAIGKMPSGFSLTSNAGGTIVSGGSLNVGFALATDTADDFGRSPGTIAFTSKSGGVGLNDTVLSLQGLSLNGKVYAPAVAQLSAGTLDFGLVHVGDKNLTETLTVKNVVTGALTDALTGQFGTIAGPFSGSGSLGTLAANATGTLTLALDTTNDGAFSVNAPLSLLSHDADQSDASVSAGPVALKGTVFAYAVPGVVPATLDFGVTRTGQPALTASTRIGNGTAADAFQESLAYTVDTLPSGFSITGNASGTIASGGSLNVGLALATGTAGDFTSSSASVTLTSKAGGVGLNDTVLSPQGLTLNGKVYAPAVAQLSSGTLDFGVVHVGDKNLTETLTVKNIVTGALTDILTGGFGAVSGPFSGSGALGAGVAAGASANLTVGLDTASAGIFTGSAPLALSSHDADLSDLAASAAPVALTATVNNFAAAAMEATSGAGSFGQTGLNYTLDFGSVAQNSGVLTTHLEVLNAATGPADLLAGLFGITGNGFGLVGFDPFSALAAGQVDGALTVSLDTSTSGSFSETITLTPTGSNASGFSATLAAETLTITATVACFLPGTQIATEMGEIPVEKLAVGDRVLTVGGLARRLTWIGVGRVMVARGRRGPATPIIVRKGALADNVPYRDLRITKGHSLYLDGMLITAESLINHRTILWDDIAQEVTVYHLELETHDVLLANGAPAESYRDDCNRWMFHNANTGWGLPPLEPFAPVLTGGPVVDAVWRRLLGRIDRGPRFPTTEEADLHLLVDGRRVDGTPHTAGIHVFRLPPCPAEVRVVSRAGVPMELGLARDPRSLGVAVRRVLLWRGAELRIIDASDPTLSEGFHLFEEINGWRWTDGDALLPGELFERDDRGCTVEVHVGCTATYPLFADQERAAA